MTYDRLAVRADRRKILSTARKTAVSGGTSASGSGRTHSPTAPRAPARLLAASTARPSCQTRRTLNETNSVQQRDRRAGTIFFFLETCSTLTGRVAVQERFPRGRRRAALLQQDDRRPSADRQSNRQQSAQPGRVQRDGRRARRHGEAPHFDLAPDRGHVDRADDVQRVALVELGQHPAAGRLGRVKPRQTVGQTIHLLHRCFDRTKDKK